MLVLHLHLSAIVSQQRLLAQNQDDHLRLNHGVYFDNRPIYLFAAEERVGARLDGEKPRCSSSCAALSRRHRLPVLPLVPGAYCRADGGSDNLWPLQADRGADER